MSMFFSKSIRHPVQAFCQRLVRDKRGVAAVEFAFVLPILAIMLLGTVEVARAVDADRRFGNATAMLTDLIAREQDLTDADLGGMMQAIAHLMRPYDPASLTLGVVAVRAPIAAGQEPKVEWSYSHNGKTVPAKCATYALPADLVSPGSRVIVVEFDLQFHAHVRELGQQPAQGQPVRRRDRLGRQGDPDAALGLRPQQHAPDLGQPLRLLLPLISSRAPASHHTGSQNCGPVLL